MEQIGLQAVFDTSNFAAGLNTYTQGVSKATGTTEQAAGSTSSFGTSVMGMAASVFAGVTAVALFQKAMGLVKDAIKAAIDASAEDQTALVQLSATLESTGRVGEISAVQIENLAKGMTGLFDTSEVMQATNALARFMDIPSSQIPDDLKLIENMAAGLGQTLPEAAQTLGNALETGRLRGLGFSKEMMNMVSTMMTAGDVAGADAIILDTLKQKFSGQASAAMDTYSGSLNVAKTAWHEYWAAVGEGLHIPEIGQKIHEATTAAVTGATSQIQYSNMVRDATDKANRSLGLRLGLLTQEEWVAMGAAGGEQKLYAELLASAMAELAPERMIADAHAESSLEANYAARSMSYLSNAYNDAADASKGPYVAAMKLGLSLQETTAYVKAYTEAKNVALSTEKDWVKAGEDAVTAYDKLDTAATKARDAAEKTRISFETSWTAAKDGAEQSKISVDELGSALMDMMDETAGKSGLVWESFLAATGKISPAALKQFVIVQEAIANVKAEIAAGWSTEDIVAKLTKDMSVNITGTAHVKWTYLKEGGEGTGFNVGPVWVYYDDQGNPHYEIGKSKTEPPVIDVPVTVNPVVKVLDTRTNGMTPEQIATFQDMLARQAGTLPITTTPTTGAPSPIDLTQVYSGMQAFVDDYYAKRSQIAGSPINVLGDSTEAVRALNKVIETMAHITSKTVILTIETVFPSSMSPADTAKVTGNSAGGIVPEGASAIVGDWPGMTTGYEELIKALPGGGVQIYPHSQTPVGPATRSGDINITMPISFIGSAEPVVVQTVVRDGILDGLRAGGRI